ncbi:MAG TPA: RNA polymerase sigma factor, partial [Candidatus Limnocylindrales bacterium]|nr:RNA polymerase sigma factor [Candidatus Limnocylindrales bacterium]
MGHLAACADLPTVTKSMARDALAWEGVVRSAATGDEAAFARLVEANHASMARVAYVVAGDPDTASDAVQAAWSIAWRKLGSLRDPGSIRAWLVAIAANEARKARASRRRELVLDISAEPPGAVMGDPIEAIGVIDLQRAMRGLSGEQRSLLAMRYVADLDATEIGRQLGISGSGVRSRLART